MVQTALKGKMPSGPILLSFLYPLVKQSIQEIWLQLTVGEKQE
jgi:hypothetical protein